MTTKRVNRVLHFGRSRTGRFAAALVVIALVGVLEAGVGVAGNKDPGADCSVPSATVQPFVFWNDSHNYFLAPGGDMESNLTTAGWQLTGGAVLAAGSESYDVTGNAGDSGSLALPSGASAQTPSLCVTIHDPQLRFFVRNTGDKKAKLSVAVSYVANDGKPKTDDLGDVTGGAQWSVTPAISFKSSIKPGSDHAGQLSFVFTPKDDKGSWSMDNLYIDPLKSQ